MINVKSHFVLNCISLLISEVGQLYLFFKVEVHIYDGNSSVIQGITLFFYYTEFSLLYVFIYSLI